MPARSREPRTDLTLKIALGGESGVGKTSLVRRFVTNTFDDRYIQTLGTKVSSRHFSVEDPERPGVTHEVGAAVWDVMGTPGFRDILREAYYANTGGVLLVCDWTRLDTLYLLPEWYDAIRSVCGDVPAVVLVNKADLATEKAVIPKAAEALCAPEGWRWLPTSAKTGDNVEAAFRLVVQLYLLRMRRTEAGTAGAEILAPSASPNTKRTP